MRTRVKVCGVTRSSDARMIVGAGADALGVILVRESPRCAIDCLDDLVPALRRMPPFVLRVAVVRDLAESVELPSGAFDAVQYYTDSTSAGFVTPLRQIQCVRVGQPGYGTTLPPLSPDVTAMLLDTYDPRRLGGTGQLMDLTQARDLVATLPVPVMLAGGLNPDNVGEVVRRVRPYAVDAAGGLEIEPGRKDPDRVAAFIREVHRASDPAGEGGLHARV